MAQDKTNLARTTAVKEEFDLITLSPSPRSPLLELLAGRSSVTVRETPEGEFEIAAYDEPLPWREWWEETLNGQRQD